MKPDSTTAPSADAAKEGSPSEAGAGMEWREYLFFREELRHEDSLINQRVAWLISSQAFLLGGFATLINNRSTQSAVFQDNLQAYLLKWLPVTGVLGVIASYVTILGAVLHVRGVRRYVARRPLPDMPALHNWHNTALRMGLFGPLATPLIFFAFWIMILVKMQ